MGGERARQPRRGETTTAEQEEGKRVVYSHCSGRERKRERQSTSFLKAPFNMTSVGEEDEEGKRRRRRRREEPSEITTVTLPKS